MSTWKLKAVTVCMDGVASVPCAHSWQTVPRGERAWESLGLGEDADITECSKCCSLCVDGIIVIDSSFLSAGLH